MQSKSTYNISQKRST